MHVRLGEIVLDQGHLILHRGPPDLNVDYQEDVVFLREGDVLAHRRFVGLQDVVPSGPGSAWATEPMISNAGITGRPGSARSYAAASSSSWSSRPSMLN